MFLKEYLSCDDFEQRIFIWIISSNKTNKTDMSSYDFLLSVVLIDIVKQTSLWVLIFLSTICLNLKTFQHLTKKTVLLWLSSDI